MLSAKPRPKGSAAIQGELWSGRTADWANIQEMMVTPLYQAVLIKTRVGSSTKLLDVGCGAGMFCKLSAEADAIISGLDAAPSLIAIARERSPYGDFRVGEMEDLPYSDKSFDLVTGFNSFQFAADPLNALQEARRVARVGSQVVAATWGKPQDCQAAEYVVALSSLMPPAPLGMQGPFALSEDGALAALVKQAGLTPMYVEDVKCTWDYPDLETALRSLLSAGPAIQAIQTAGEQKVREAVTNAIAPFEQPTGGYQLKNLFRYVIAMRLQ